MTHQLPQLLPHCDHKHFCDSCRDREGGRVFRAGVLERQGIECHVDFECPKGKPWGKQPRPPPPAPPKVPDERTLRLAIARAEVCATCPDLDTDRGGVKLTVVSGIGTSYPLTVACKRCSTCGGGISLVKAARVCKAGKWDNIKPATA